MKWKILLILVTTIVFAPIWFMVFFTQFPNYSMPQISFLVVFGIFLGSSVSHLRKAQMDKERKSAKHLNISR